jgi:hypothetical protein
MCEAADVDLIVAYDPAIGLAVWLRLNDVNEPAWRVLIRLDAAGRLKLDVIDRCA